MQGLREPRNSRNKKIKAPSNQLYQKLNFDCLHKTVFFLRAGHIKDTELKLTCIFEAVQ